MESNQKQYQAILKPDHISFQMIADVLHDAHRANEKKGMHFTAAKISALELEEHVGVEGEYAVVLDGEEICAVGAVKYRKWNKWFCKDQLCGDIMLVGVRERYKGNGLSNLIYHKLEETAFKKCSVVTMNTATENKIMLQSRIHDGWRYVDFFSHKGTDFYSVMLAKWRENPPCSAVYCAGMYIIRKTLVKMVRKENGDYRLWVRLIGKDRNGGEERK